MPPYTDGGDQTNAPKSRVLLLLCKSSWWGINTSDFILETSAPSISPKPIVNLWGTNSQGREAEETKGLGTNVFLPKMDFLGIPYNIKQLISP